MRAPALVVALCLAFPAVGAADEPSGCIGMITPPDHLNTKLSSGVGEVIETMMAKNRENRYRNPDDLILDLKCLIQGERPMIAEQKASALAGLTEGEVSEEAENLIANAELGRIDKSIMVGDDDLKKAYEANKKEYEQVKASHRPSGETRG